MGLLLVLAASPPAGAVPTAGGGDPLLELRAWTDRFARAGRPLDVSEEQGLRTLLDRVRRLGEDHPERGPEIDLALLDLGAADPGRGSRAPLLPPATASTKSIALGELDRRIAGDRAGKILPWLAAEVLDEPKVHGPERRVMAAQALAGRYSMPTLPSLLRAARDPAPAVQRAGLAALVGWPDAAVHVFFLERIDRDATALPALQEHLAAVRGELGPHALDRLRASVGRLYVSEDWRDAARARRLVDFLDPRRAVPILIESLSVWKRRGEEGAGSKRIQYEILEELQRISGRSIGIRPDLWNQWWQAVRDGRVDLPELDGEGQDAYTTATFFGLRPASDRVIFVVDRSGSMEGPMGTAGRARFDEAVFQLFRFLESAGEETRFSIVVFNDRAARWRNRLAPATSSNLAQARRWLEAKRPVGGTQLREGVRRALDANRDDDLSPDKIEADTVIVLCDGATSEGAGWVRPWLLRENGDAELVFHCVQIGTGGDGTLEALAAATDGDFVRVEG